VRHYVITQLVGLGYRAIPAANADEALVLIDQGTVYDLLFTDVIMSGSKSGRELADEVLRRWPSVMAKAAFRGQDCPEGPTLLL
jgi:CheY-like chemotaxis protein